MSVSDFRKNFVYARGGDRCAHCGCELDYSNHSIDHFIPRSYGGDNDLRNLVPLCRCCNSKKSNKLCYNVDRYYPYTTKATRSALKRYINSWSLRYSKIDLNMANTIRECCGFKLL